MSQTGPERAQSQLLLRRLLPEAKQARAGDVGATSPNERAKAAAACPARSSALDPDPVAASLCSRSQSARGRTNADRRSRARGIGARPRTSAPRATASGRRAGTVVTSRRLGRILDLLGEVGDPDASLDWLCGTCAQELGVSGAAVALILSGQDPGNIAASDELAAAVVDLQFSTGEGPAIDAHRSRRAVLEPELSSSTRWPAFAPEAVAVGAAAVFALLLQVGAARSGALTLYRDRPGPLGEGVLTDALAMAEVACEITLGLQAQVPPGSLHEVLNQLAAKRTELYQATGMVVVQLDVGPEGAVAAIRARAYATDRPVDEVAADVVARRFRFER